MNIQVIDNVERKIASVLIPAIAAANDIRIAVAYVSNDGLKKIMPSMHDAISAGATIEFMVGMDTHATDPVAIKKLYDLCQNTPRASLLCFAPKNRNLIYHPKMYLARDNQKATAIIGSSNLTRRGLTKNIEANLVIEDNVDAVILSEIYATYTRLKFHPDRVIPDGEFLAMFTELRKEEQAHERKIAKSKDIRKLRESFEDKVKNLQRPIPTRTDLVGWLELVYDSLPEGSFTNQDIYQFEPDFRQYYPENLNIRAKIRQQLQYLRELGFIEQISRGVWRKAL